jgi:hypothetical protein
MEGENLAEGVVQHLRSVIGAHWIAPFTRRIGSLYQAAQRGSGPDGFLDQCTTTLQGFPRDKHAGVWWQIDRRQIVEITDRLVLHDDSSHCGHTGTGGNVSALQPSRSFRHHCRLVLRQSEGFIQALLAMIDVSWHAPDHMTLSRRQTEVSVDLSVQSSDQPRYLVADSTGLTVYGEGEWTTLQWPIRT